MAILDHFRFGSSRKPSYVTSDAASGSSGRSNNSSKSNKSNGNPLKLAKSFSWKTLSDISTSSDDSNDSNANGGMCNTNDRPEKGVPSWLKKKNKKDTKKSKKNLHPSEKPLTLDNIQHQEMLSHFTWTFGNRRDSFDARSIDGVSPGTSRMPSFDGGSRPMPPGGEAQGNGNDGQVSMFLSPDSAAYSRRPAMHMTD